MVRLGLHNQAIDPRGFSGTHKGEKMKQKTYRKMMDAAGKVVMGSVIAGYLVMLYWVFFSGGVR